MKALLLAAGLGTRLRPLTEKVPKCLVPILGKPLLQYWLELLFEGGVSEVLVNTHYLPGEVRAFHEASPWRDRITLVHEETLLGTGGTVLANRRFFGGFAGLVAHADNLTVFSAADFMRAHANRPAVAAMTMMTFETDVPESCGIVELDDAGLVRRFHEKVPNPPGNRANAAVYIIEPEIVEFVAGLHKEFVDLSTEVIPHFLGRIATFQNRKYHRDIGTLDSLSAAEREYRQDAAGY